MYKHNYKQTLEILIISYLTALSIVYGIHFWWITTFEYGWEYNETTLPILIKWSIFFRIILFDMIIAIPVSIFITAILCLWMLE